LNQVFFKFDFKGISKNGSVQDSGWFYL